MKPRLLDDVTEVPESGDEFKDDFPEENSGRDVGDEEVEEDDDGLGIDDIDRSAMLIARALSSLLLLLLLWLLFSFSSSSAG